MKIVRLTTTIAILLMMAAINVYGEKAQTNEDPAVEADHKAISCPSGCKGGCGTNCRQVCQHGFRSGHCKHGCLSNHYGYGRTQVCPGKQNGICPVHGYGACPHQRQPIGPALREAFTPADRPYFGTQPMMGPHGWYGPNHGGPGYGGPGYGGPGYGGPGFYDPNYRPLFPRLRTWLCCPPEPKYMTTAPAPPMPTYTTRGPRDFLNPNPPSIGY